MLCQCVMMEVIQTRMGKSIWNIPSRRQMPEYMQNQVGNLPVFLCLQLNYDTSRDHKKKTLLAVNQFKQLWLGISHSLDIRNLHELLSPYLNQDQETKDLTAKKLHSFYQLEIQDSIQRLVSLQLHPVPRKWWTTSNRCSNVIM